MNLLKANDLMIGLACRWDHSRKPLSSTIASSTRRTDPPKRLLARAPSRGLAWLVLYAGLMLCSLRVVLVERDLLAVN